MLRWLRSPDLASVILRITLASIFITHGGLKIVYFTGGTSWYAEDDIPAAIQAIVAWSELVGGVAMALGLFTRVAALGLIVIMLGAIYTVTWKLDFIGVQSHDLRAVTVGYEYNYTIIGLCASLVVLGGGTLSIDYLLFGHRSEAAAAPVRAQEPVGAPV